MAEGRNMNMNNLNVKAEGNENMENYPDSLNSSPRSRDTDPEYFGGGNNRWDAVDQGGGGGATGAAGGGRVRLMCSCGGKILPRPHDNQLTYVGGDTRILTVERNIRFPAMVAKMATLWGTAVSFKYQLPNEDLDALVSVTNEEDLENMMGEYDRLLKSGYKFSRLRLFAFPTKESGSAASSLGSSVMEDSGRREQWFVDALNNHPPVSQAPAVATSAWVNNMPDYLFGLENNNNNSNNNNNNVGDEDLKQQKQQPPQNCDNCDGRGLENSNSTRTYEEGNRQGAVQEGVTRPAGDRAPNVNYQEVNNPRAQVVPPVQEFQKMQLKPQPPPEQVAPPAQVPAAPVARQVQEESQRKIYSDPVRAPGGGGGPDVGRSAPEPPPQAAAYQNAPPEYYTPELQHQPPPAPSHGHFNPQSLAYWQMHDHAGAGVYLVPAGSAMNMMPAMPSVRPPAGYYNPSVMPRMNLPQPVYEACPPVPTVRPMGMVQRQNQNPAEVADQYRDAQAAPPPLQQQQPVVGVSKMPAVYGMPPGGGGMMYRGPTPVQVGAGHQQEGYPYAQQHVMYDTNPTRQVYYTQALNPPYQPVGPVAADLHASPPEMTGPSQEQQQAKVGRV